MSETWDLPYSKPKFLAPYDLASLRTEAGFEKLVQRHQQTAVEFVRRMRGEIIPPTIYLYCPVNPVNGVVQPGIYEMHSDPVLFQDSRIKEAMSIAGRMTAHIGQALAAVSMIEVWHVRRDTAGKTGEQIREEALVPPSNSPDREEAIMLVVEIKDRKVSYLGPLKRFPPNGATVSFGPPEAATTMTGLFHDLLEPIDISNIDNLNPRRETESALERIIRDAERRGKA